jgi:hypothetical protein
VTEGFRVSLANAHGTDRFSEALAAGPFPTSDRAGMYGAALLRAIGSPRLVALVTSPEGYTVRRVGPFSSTPVPDLPDPIVPEASDPPEAETPPPIPAKGHDMRERAAIRAGLRALQMILTDRRIPAPGVRAILSDHGDVSPLDVVEIDALLRRLQEA